MSTQDAMRRRVEATLARIAGDPDAGMTAHAPSLQRLLDVDHGGLQRAACHRDLGEHNLILDGEGKLHLIDFGRAAPDFLLADLVPSRLDVWPGRPDLQRAFEEGFGAPIGEDTRVHLDQLALLYAINPVLWGRGHGRGERVSLGERWISVLSSA